MKDAIQKTVAYHRPSDPQVWILAPSCQGGHHKIRPKGHSPTKTRGFPFRFVKIQTLFHKTDPTGTLNGLRFTKPWKTKLTGGNTRLHARPQDSETAASSFRPVQICSKFQKTDNTRRSTGPRSTKPKNCRPERWATRHHEPLQGPRNAASTNRRLHQYSRAHTRRPYSVVRSRAKR